MAQIRTRINLSARSFPLVQENWGRTVIVSEQDQNFNRQVQASTDTDHDVGIPQIYYAHNVMPHAQGFQSIGYLPIVAGSTGGYTFVQVFNLLDDLGNFALFATTTDGTWLTWENSVPVWTVRATGQNTTNPISTAFCSGKTYIYQRSAGAFIFNFTTKNFDAVTLTGLDTTVVNGLTSSFGYLIAWSSIRVPGTTPVNFTNGSNVIVSTYVGPPPINLNILVGQVVTAPQLPAGTTVLSVSGANITVSNAATATASGSISYPGTPGAIFWSSTINETDFTPSLITGAGGGAVQGLVGTLVCCVPHTKGFLIYGTGNIVAASYSQNSRYPFDAQPIVGSGGVTDRSLVTTDANTNGHFAYTTSGLQSVGMGSCDVILTDVTDFVSGKLFEDFDDVLKVFTQTELTQTMKKRLAIVANRYLIISYGVNSLTHALVYDAKTTRMGKLRINHVMCFELFSTVLGVTEISRQSIAFLQADGTVQTVNFDTRSSGSNGTLLLGKYQYVRARNLILDEVWIENVYNYANFSLTAMVALYGKTFSSTPTLAPDSTDNTRRQAHYKCRAEGENVSLLLQGQFHLESGVIEFHPGGKR